MHIERALVVKEDKLHICMSMLECRMENDMEEKSYPVKLIINKYGRKYI